MSESPNRRTMLIAGAAGLVVLAGAGVYLTQDSGPTPTDGDAADLYLPLIEPRILGNPDAPVLIVEYSSMTCPHCAAFHRETLPLIKDKYIDTGLVKLEYRDFPLNTEAALGALLARCAPEDRFFPLADLIFAQQSRWAGPGDKIEALKQLGRFSGMGDAELDACFDNDPLYNAISDQREVWGQNFEINRTPTFFINGTLVSGARPYSEFEAVIESKLN